MTKPIGSRAYKSSIIALESSAYQERKCYEATGCSLYISLLAAGYFGGSYRKGGRNGNVSIQHRL